MMIRRNRKRVVTAVIAGLCLCACQTVGVPDIEDIMKSPEFSQDAANIGEDYPDIADAPAAPTDIRSDKQWDNDARAMQALRDDSNKIPAVAELSEAETNRQFEDLKAKVHAYKKDDPASGPIQPVIPNYQPRR